MLACTTTAAPPQPTNPIPSPSTSQDPKDDKVIRCYDPCSGRLLGSGSATAMSAEEVKAAVGRARKAQASWAQTSFEQRREFLRLLMDFVVENQEDLCRVASRDTGKTRTFPGGRGEGEGGRETLFFPPSAQPLPISVNSGGWRVWRDPDDV